jgi:hypothetical protein
VKERPRVREQILKLGMRPYIIDGLWDGYSMIDDGSGRMHAWLDRQGCTGRPDSIRRVALTGSMEKEAQRMAREGYWGEVNRAPKRPLNASASHVRQ